MRTPSTGALIFFTIHMGCGFQPPVMPPSLQLTSMAAPTPHSYDAILIMAFVIQWCILLCSVHTQAYTHTHATNHIHSYVHRIQPVIALHSNKQHIAKCETYDPAANVETFPSIQILLVGNIVLNIFITVRYSCFVTGNNGKCVDLDIYGVFSHAR